MGQKTKIIASVIPEWYNDVRKGKTSDTEGGICFSRHINERAEREAVGRAREGEQASGEAKGERRKERAGTSTSMQSAKRSGEPERASRRVEKRKGSDGRSAPEGGINREEVE